MDLMCSQDIDLIAVTVNGCNWTNQNDVFKVDSPDSAYVIVLTARSMNEINSGVRLNSQQLNAVPNPTIDNNNYTYTLNVNCGDLDWNNIGEFHTSFIAFGLDTYSRPGSVTLHHENGENDSTVDCTVGAQMPAVTPPQKDGCTFDGYFTSADGGTQYYYADGTSAHAYTEGVADLYAHWLTQCDLNGHSYTYTSNGNGTHDVACENCDYSDPGVACNYRETFNAATCAKGSYTAYECTDCGYAYDGPEADDKIAHTYGDEGEARYTCTECGAVDETLKAAVEAAEQLAAAKTAAKAELDGYKNAADYRAAEKEALAAAVSAGKDAIDAAQTAEAVADALTNAKAAVDAIKTDAQLTEKEIAAFESYKTAQRSVADALAQPGDSEACAALIAAAKSSTDALTYDGSKTYAENIDEVFSVVPQLISDLTAQRAADAETPEQPDEPENPEGQSDGFLSRIVEFFRSIINFFARLFGKNDQTLIR